MEDDSLPLIVVFEVLTAFFLPLRLLGLSFITLCLYILSVCHLLLAVLLTPFCCFHSINCAFSLCLALPLSNHMHYGLVVLFDPTTGTCLLTSRRTTSWTCRRAMTSGRLRLSSSRNVGGGRCFVLLPMAELFVIFSRKA